MDSINEISKKLKKRRLDEAKINYSELDHDILIQMAQQGDDKAGEELIKQYDPLISRQASRYILDSGDEEDIKQIATIAFWEAVMSYEVGSMKHGFSGYANLMMHRKLTDELRKDSAEKRKLHTQNMTTSFDDVISNDGEGGNLTVGDTVASDDLSPEEFYLGEEGARKIMNFIRDKFSERERDVVMRHIKGDKIPKIMEETGLSYKAVENTLVRIKNKLAEYMRTSYKESKRMRRGEDIKFSDEEKKILESVITKINTQEALKERKIMKLKESYENYTEEQFDKLLDEIEKDIDWYVEKVKSLHYDDDERYYTIDEAADIKTILLGMEGFLTDVQQERADSLMSILNNLEDVEYEGPERRPVDPYEERGISRYDFFDDREA